MSIAPRRTRAASSAAFWDAARTAAVSTHAAATARNMCIASTFNRGARRERREVFSLRSWRSRRLLSRDDLRNQRAVHVGEPHVAPVEPVGQLLMIDAEQVQ